METLGFLHYSFEYVMIGHNLTRCRMPSVFHTLVNTIGATGIQTFGYNTRFTELQYNFALDISIDNGR